MQSRICFSLEEVEAWVGLAIGNNYTPESLRLAHRLLECGLNDEQSNHPVVQAIIRDDARSILRAGKDMDLRLDDLYFLHTVRQRQGSFYDYLCSIGIVK